jgi:hypothetical protein
LVGRKNESKSPEALVEGAAALCGQSKLHALKATTPMFAIASGKADSIDLND